MSPLCWHPRKYILNFMLSLTQILFSLRGSFRTVFCLDEIEFLEIIEALLHLSRRAKSCYVTSYCLSKRLPFIC